MPQNFVYPQRDQPLLLPVDVREWLPEDDLVFVVLDAVATLDLVEFRRRYRADGHGRAAFDPEMMVALLLYGYCQGERSSRVIEKRCVRDVATGWSPAGCGPITRANTVRGIDPARPDSSGIWADSGSSGYGSRPTVRPRRAPVLANGTALGHNESRKIAR